MSQVKSGFFFECSDLELERLRDMGGGDPSKGLRALLENSTLKNTATDIMKDIGKVLTDNAPAILTGIMTAKFGGKHGKK